MSLEARVTEFEENRVHWDQVLTGIEGTVALILKEQMELKKKAEQHDKRFDQQDERLDKIEELLIQIVNNLASR